MILEGEGNDVQMIGNNKIMCMAGIDYNHNITVECNIDINACLKEKKFLEESSGVSFIGEGEEPKKSKFKEISDSMKEIARKLRDKTKNKTFKRCA